MSGISMSDVLDVIQTQKDDDFISKNGAWVLTVIGIASACVGGVLTYFLRSRCHKLKFGCIECDRSVVDLKPSETTIVTHADED